MTRHLRTCDGIAVLGLCVSVALGTALLYLYACHPFAVVPLARASCLGHVRALYLGLAGYAANHDGVLPSSLGEMVDAQDPLLCPYKRLHMRRNPNAYPFDCDYDNPAAGLKLDRLKAFPHFAVVFDKTGNHPDGTRNVAFADGSTNTIPEDEFQRMLRHEVREAARDADLAGRLQPYLRQPQW